MPSVTVIVGYLFMYSMAMFSLPFVAFFGVRYSLNYFGVDGFANIVWSVLAAVFTVNLIILCYVIKAWNEPEPKREKQEDSNRKED